LHLAVDADTGEIVACVLTDNGADDAGDVPAGVSKTWGRPLACPGPIDLADA
jgi:hypothetical protein